MKRNQMNGDATTTAGNLRFPGSRRRGSAETDETIENPSNDAEAEELAQYTLADEVIRQLRIAQYDVGAITDYNNNIVDKSAQAFAKIAGRTWTFYVSALAVVIGRPGSGSKQRTSAGSATTGDTPVVLDDLKVDIDLGPDQQVSRFHAQISFDGEEEKWYIFVNGRNGLHLDSRRLERGQRAWLHSGAVISIVGTQMMFMLPSVAPVIHPDIRKQVLAEDEEDTEPETKEEKKPFGSGRGGRGRTSNAYQTGSARPVSQPQARSFGQAASSSQLQPGTPAGKTKEQGQPRSKPSPAYSRGVMMESTEEIDYSVDSAKDIKPPHSYASMIGQAILSSSEENATLSKIYEYIKDHYAFFRHNGGGWQVCSTSHRSSDFTNIYHRTRSAITCRSASPLKRYPAVRMNLAKA
jgi:pSer/pThr/pTyr-binding forkhead associated (FHA) protein